MRKKTKRKPTKVPELSRKDQADVQKAFKGLAEFKPTSQEPCDDLSCRSCYNNHEYDYLWGEED